jgi:hypothetical protein
MLLVPPIHPPRFGKANNIWWRVQIMKFLIMNISQFSSYLHSVPNILRGNLFPNSNTVCLHSVYTRAVCNKSVRTYCVRQSYRAVIVVPTEPATSFLLPRGNRTKQNKTVFLEPPILECNRAESNGMSNSRDMIRNNADVKKKHKHTRKRNV